MNCPSPSMPHERLSELSRVDRLRKVCSSLGLGAILLLCVGCQAGPYSMGGLSRVPPPGTVNGYSTPGGYYGTAPMGAAGGPATSAVIPGSVAPVSYNGPMNAPVNNAAYSQNTGSLRASSIQSGGMIPATDLTRISGGSPASNSVQPTFSNSGTGTGAINSSFSDGGTSVNSSNLPSTASSSSPTPLHSNASEVSAFNYPDAPQQEWK